MKKGWLALGRTLVVAAVGSVGAFAREWAQRSQAARAIQTTDRPTTSTASPVDLYNPEHDPNKCVRGFVVLTLLMPIRPEPQ